MSQRKRQLQRRRERERAHCLSKTAIPRWMKQRRLLTILTLARGFAWTTDDGHREAEDEDGSTSDTSILCTRDCDLPITIN